MKNWGDNVYQGLAVAKDEAAYFTKFGGLLRWSAPRPIVERSRKDRFWGAVLEKDGVLRGQNRLGQLLVELREELLAARVAGQESRLLRVEPPQVPDFLLLGQAIGVIKVHAGSNSADRGSR